MANPIGEFKELWKRAYENPEEFWSKKAEDAFEDIYWFKKWEKAFEWEYPRFSWFSGGKTNISYNCTDYKLKRYGSKPAYIYEAPEFDLSYSVTYNQLYSMVKKYASALRGAGVEKGDRVLLYLPNSIEAAAMLLACARIGAISVTVFAGFSPGAVADRIELTTPKLILTQDFNLRRGNLVKLKENIDTALRIVPEEVSKNVKYVVVRRMMPEQEVQMNDRDLLLREFLKLGRGESHDYVEMQASDPIFIMPTSGTTGKPKPVVHVQGGYQIWNYWTAKWVYGLKPEDIIFNTSDIGWIVGQSYMIFGPLLAGATCILLDGTPDYPEPGIWYEVIERNRATLIWTSPTGARILRKLGSEKAKEYDLSSVERVVCAGEVLNPEVWHWLYREVFDGKLPIIDHMWQTETTGAIFGYPYGLGGEKIKDHIKPGSAGLPMPGVVPVVLDELTGKELGTREKGILYLKRPFPGLTPTLWDSFERYVNSYWEVGAGRGYYCTGDAAYMDEDGYVWFTGRADEVMKIAGHRIGTIEVENALISHPAVAEAGVCGVPDDIRGEVAAAFVVLKPGYSPGDQLKKELIDHVRKTLGPIVVFKDIQFVNVLPKTRSGKIMRRVMKRLILGQELGDLSTLEEEASVEEVKEAVSRIKKL
ncbi:acetate--CoA ligase [Archaeoglobus neptunius]|uniref:acetate--CoA ligase n=1 Tax=Archaeoglobus neptunius TaxID=2798580 RepID=UPI001E45A1C1|nr:acetate--CoA ligase [Archaeoglobus neptunius]